MISCTLDEAKGQSLYLALATNTKTRVILPYKGALAMQFCSQPYIESQSCFMIEIDRHILQPK